MGLVFSQDRVQVPTNEGISLVDYDVYYRYKHEYFVGEDGIRFGHKDFSKMIIPKEILIEAINKYMGVGE